MKQRILEFLKTENKSSAQFAEEIGVQPSGISHILSGRNNPSLDFVLKMLERYQFLSSEWLLFGRGSMYKDHNMQTLFDVDSTAPDISRNSGTEFKDPVSEKVLPDIHTAGKDNTSKTENKPYHSEIKRIVWFYNDNRFEEYLPK